jgi:hypothetical protein
MNYFRLRVFAKLEEIFNRLGVIERLLSIRGEQIMSALDDLTAQVAANTSLESSAVALIQGIPALIAAAGIDPAKLIALQTQLTLSATALAAAIVANTPVAPVTPVIPPVLA